MLGQKPARTAFTLVELLVVIGIIAVLIAILLPTIAGARRQAQTTACAANLRSIGQAIKIYETEFKTYPFSRYYGAPTASGGQTAGDGGTTSLDQITHTWWSLIRKIMRGGKGNWDNSIVNQDGSQVSRFMAAFNCPAGLNRDAGCDFGSNPVIMPDLVWETSTGPHATTTIGNRQLRRPATSKSLYPDNIILADAAEIPPNYNTQYIMMYALDGQRMSNASSLTNAQCRFRGLVPGSSSLNDGSLADPGPNKEVDSGNAGTIGQIRWRHGRNDTANFLFADSSVRSMKMTTKFGTPDARGELTRALLRPKPYPGYRVN